MSRRIGVMGGTFDPIHLGHLVAAEEARWQFGLDRVVFVPAGRPWQKPVGVTPAEDRYRMTVLATASNPAFAVSRLEIDHPGPTYTVDTLRRLMSAECSAPPPPLLALRWYRTSRAATLLPRSAGTSLDGVSAWFRRVRSAQLSRAARATLPTERPDPGGGSDAWRASSCRMCPRSMPAGCGW